MVRGFYLVSNTNSAVQAVIPASIRPFQQELSAQVTVCNANHRPRLHRPPWGLRRQGHPPHGLAAAPRERFRQQSFRFDAAAALPTAAVAVGRSHAGLPQAGVFRNSCILNHVAASSMR